MTSETPAKGFPNIAAQYRQMANEANEKEQVKLNAMAEGMISTVFSWAVSQAKLGILKGDFKFCNARPHYFNDDALCNAFFQNATAMNKLKDEVAKYGFKTSVEHAPPEDLSKYHFMLHVSW